MSVRFWKEQIATRSYEIRYSAMGVALGVAISAGGLAADAFLRELGGADASLGVTFASTYMHSFMLTAPLVLGYGFSLVGGWRRKVDETLRMTREMEALARERSIRDPVTGLFNRVHLIQRLEEGLATREWKVRGGLVFLLDLDDFKLINDTYGHNAGDAVLIEIARRILHLCEAADIAVRLGGDEFVVVHFPSTSGEDTGTSFANELVRSLGADIRIGNAHIVPGTSIGFARVGHDGMTCSDVLKAADLALYQAKKEPGSAFRMFEPAMRNESERVMRMESDMRLGIERDEFFLEYQPILGAGSGAVRSFEALLRWRHPERGIVPPKEFIPVAESAGLILPLGRMVLLEACRIATRWPKPIAVSVNLSSVQFNDPGLLAYVEAVLRDTGLAPGRLDLEITESFLIQAEAKVQRTMGQLKALGVRITMDDFGTGYSSLGTLKNFPFDRLKIDRSFTRDVTGDAEDAEIVRTIVRLSQVLKMETVLEGVETEEQFAFARSIGVTEVQGFHFSRSIPADGIEALLAARRGGSSLAGAA